MRKYIILCTMIGYSFLSAQSIWKADVACSSLNFSISHLLFSEVSGSFANFYIEATANENFDTPSFTARIETSSLNTNNNKRDKDLRDKDYFDSTNYPYMDFKSTSYKKTGDKKFVLGGDLTIKGTTKYVELEGKLNDITTDPQSNKLKARFEFSGTIDRKQYNVGSSIIPMGDEATITIHLEMVRQGVKL